VMFFFETNIKRKGLKSIAIRISLAVRLRLAEKYLFHSMCN
jgi:hypothetical protein